MDPISEIHAALTPLLRPYFAPRKWQIEPVPFPLSLTEFQRLLGVTPWIGVQWREFKTDANAGRQIMGVHELALTICVKNASGREARLTGDRTAPGLYPALATASAALHGKTLPGIGTLHVSRAGQAYADGFGDLTVAIGVVELQLRTKFGDVLGAVEEAPAFAQLVSAFELDPPREGGVPVTDTIDLES